MPDAEPGPASLAGLRGAVSFLTLVPPGRGEVAGADVGRGAIYFPVVGAAVGGAVGITAWAAALEAASQRSNNFPT